MNCMKGLKSAQIQLSQDGVKSDQLGRTNPKHLEKNQREVYQNVNKVWLGEQTIARGAAKQL